MKLCYVGPGQSIHLQRWLGAFVGRGHQVHLIALPDTEADIQGVTVHRLGPGRPKLRFANWTLAARRVLQDIRPDILHAHYLTRYGWLAAATLFKPLVLTAWGTDAYLDPERSRAGRWVTAWALRRAALVTADAVDLAQRVVTLGAAPERVQVIQMGVDTRVFCPGLDTTALRTQLALGNAPVVLSTRSLLPNYQQDLILQAMPLILSQAPAAVLVIKYNDYDPAYRASLQARVAELHLVDAVRFVGATGYEELAHYYALGDIFVSVARSDSTPVSLLEAMACGAVPVVSDLPALREWIVDGENGYCVSPSDAGALAEAVVKLLLSRELRRKCAATNRRLIEERADHEREMDRMERLYLAIGQKFQMYRIL